MDLLVQTPSFFAYQQFDTAGASVRPLESPDRCCAVRGVEADGISGPVGDRGAVLGRCGSSFKGHQSDGGKAVGS